MSLESWVLVEKADTLKDGMEVEAALVFAKRAALSLPPQHTMD